LIDLRKLAKGKECQARFCHHDGTPICNFDPATTVLAHVRLSGVAGIGQKPPNLCGIWACSSCHDVLDGRAGIFAGPGGLEKDILHALVRTLAEVSKEIGYG